MHGLVTMEMAQINEQEHMRAAMMRRNASIVRRERRRRALRSRFMAWLARSHAGAPATSGSSAVLHPHGGADAR